MSLECIDVLSSFSEFFTPGDFYKIYRDDGKFYVTDDTDFTWEMNGPNVYLEPQDKSSPLVARFTQ